MVNQGLERRPSALSLHSSHPASPGVPGSSPPPESPMTPNGVSRTPSGSFESRIPRSSAFQRSSSLRVRGERVNQLRSTLNAIPSPNDRRLSGGFQPFRPDSFPVITENGTASPDSRRHSLSLTPSRPRRLSNLYNREDSDLESVKSYGSSCSTASACDHSHFALNGTTWSARSRKYIVHCSNQSADNAEYLTPTQRSNREVRRYQNKWDEAKKAMLEKDQEIERLMKEIVELKVGKASLNSPDDKTDSSDALTVKENSPFSPESDCKELPEEDELKSPTTPEKKAEDMTRSLADSGNFDDESTHSKEGISAAGDNGSSAIAASYEEKIADLKRQHIDNVQEIKEKHNEKVEDLVKQLEKMSEKYYELFPALDKAHMRVRLLEQQVENYMKEMKEQKTIAVEQDQRNVQMYLKMFAKGQEAARLEQTDQMLQHNQPDQPKVTIPELLRKLSVTQAELENIKAMYRRIVESRKQGSLDPEITLQFLRSAIYYFLTDKENHHGHLNAIESILGFTDNEKSNIDKLYRSVRK